MSSNNGDRKRRIPEEKSTKKTIPLRPIVTGTNRITYRTISTKGTKKTPSSASTETTHTAAGRTSGTAENLKSYSTTKESSRNKPKPKSTATTSSSSRSKTSKQPSPPLLTITFKSQKSFVEQWSKKGGRGLLTSFMSGRTGSSSRNKNTGFIEEILTAHIMGSEYLMYADVCFSEASSRKRSNPCRLLIDTDSPITWITDKAYRKAFQGINDNPSYPQQEGWFKAGYGLTQIDLIHGALYEGAVSLYDERISVQKLTFGIVDVSGLDSQAQDELARAGRVGILGLRSNPADTKARDDKNRMSTSKSIPTFLDRLKAEQTIPKNIVGMTIRLPNDQNNYKYKGRLTGELHFGGPRDDAYDKNTMMMIPTITEGKHAVHYTIQLELKCGNTKIMDRSKGNIDSGSSRSYLPLGVMSRYREEVNRCANKEVVKYKDNLIGNRIYYLAKKDFGYLKDIEFRFSTGQREEDMASFKLPPTALVYPPNLATNISTIAGKVFPEFEEGGTLFFTFEDGPANFANFILGASWIMWHYTVLDASSESRMVGIAEIKDRKKHQWNGLEQLP